MKIARIMLTDGTIRLARVTGERLQLLAEEPDRLIDLCMRRGGDALPHVDEIAFEDARFLTPIPTPPSLRDFMAFEDHVRNCTEGSGGRMHPEWHDQPVFYFSNPAAVTDPEADIAIPRNSRSLDFELEIACVIGSEARDLDPEAADWSDCVAGFMLMNDWSARDLAAKEMKQGLGPAKGKDFATSLGPWLTTPDELVDPMGGMRDLPLVARVNGTVKSRGRLGAMHFPWPRILAHASANTVLRRGDIIGSGTVGTGCILELRITRGREENPWLSDGDVVELEAESLGILRNTVRQAA